MKTLQPHITIIEKTDLFPSPTNPRKKFDPEKLSELAGSIRQRGIKSPLLARPVGGKFEIVAGERRFRAGGEAGLEVFPCIVEEMSDAEVLELQLIENLQRDDLDPIEESEHYHRMLELGGKDGVGRYTVALLAERIGKPIARIRRLLKLRDLPKNMRDALAAGDIGANLASLVARIPSKALRERAATDILNHHDGPMSQRQAIEHIHEEFMIELKGAPFDPKDAELVPVAFSDAAKTQRCQGGACEDCPLRTGNNRELYGDETRGDVCTNPPCYALKRDAAWKKTIQLAQSDGKKILSEKETQSLFYYGSNELSWNSPWFELDKQPPADLLAGGNQKGVQTWRKLIDGGPCKVEIVVTRSPKGRIIEIADRGQLLAAAKQNGHEKLFDKNVRVGSEKSPAEQKAAKAEREKARLDAALTAAGFAELRKSLEGWEDTPQFWGQEADFWWILLESAMERHAGSDGQKLMCRMLDLKPVKRGYNEDRVGPVLAYAKTFAKDSRRVASLAVMALLSQDLRWQGVGATFFKKFADFVRLDVSALRDRVKQELNEKKKPVTPAPVLDLSLPPVAEKKAKKVTPEKPSKKSKDQPASPSQKILAALKDAGKPGATAADIAKSSGVPVKLVSVWLASTGKKHKSVLKVSSGRYRFLA